MKEEEEEEEEEEPKAKMEPDADDPFDTDIADVTLQAVSIGSSSQASSSNSNNACRKGQKEDCSISLPSSSMVEENARSSSVCSSLEDFHERPSSSIATQDDAHGSVVEDLDMDMVDSVEDMANSSGETLNSKGDHEVTGASNDAVNCQEEVVSSKHKITSTAINDNSKESSITSGTNGTNVMPSVTNRQGGYRRKKHAWRRGKYTRSTGHSKGRGRRSILKKVVYKSPASFAAPVTLDSLMYNGILYRKGDIVAMRNEDASDETIYFAQIRGFLVDQYAQKTASITWLLPSSGAPEDGSFDPAFYFLGPEEDSPRPLNSMEFVCHAPSDYYQHKSPFPLQPDPINLTNLGYVWTRLGVVQMARKGEQIEEIETNNQEAT